MNKLLILILIISSMLCYSKNNTILPENIHSKNDIIPSDWRLLDSISGDLNNDGILDFVLAIQKNDSNKIKLNDGFGVDTINLNPRKLAIYYGTESDELVKKLVSDEFIILRDNPTMEEPFEGFDLNNEGILDINFRIAYNAGSWSVSIHKYRFRFQNNQLVLIGYDLMKFHRASGETKNTSINFLSKRMKISKGTISSDEPESIEWKEFKLEKLFDLKAMEKPFELEFEGIYL